MWGEGMYFGGIMWFWLALSVIAAVCWVKYASERNNSRKDMLDDGSVLSVLKMRLAKGEITEEEYISLKDTLEA